MVLELPMWGQWGLVGFLLAVVGLVVTQLIRGDLVTRGHLERERELMQFWRDAWVEERKASAEYAEAITRNTELVDALQAVLRALPRPEGGGDEPDAR